MDKDIREHMKHLSGIGDELKKISLECSKAEWEHRKAKGTPREQECLEEYRKQWEKYDEICKQMENLFSGVVGEELLEKATKNNGDKNWPVPTAADRGKVIDALKDRGYLDTDLKAREIDGMLRDLQHSYTDLDKAPFRKEKEEQQQQRKNALEQEMSQESERYEEVAPSEKFMSREEYDNSYPQEKLRELGRRYEKARRELEACKNDVAAETEIEGIKHKRKYEQKKAAYNEVLDDAKDFFLEDISVGEGNFDAITDVNYQRGKRDPSVQEARGNVREFIERSGIPGFEASTADVLLGALRERSSDNAKEEQAETEKHASSTKEEKSREGTTPRPKTKEEIEEIIAPKSSKDRARRQQDRGRSVSQMETQQQKGQDKHSAFESFIGSSFADFSRNNGQITPSMREKFFNEYRRSSAGTMQNAEWNLLDNMSKPKRSNELDQFIREALSHYGQHRDKEGFVTAFEGKFRENFDSIVYGRIMPKQHNQQHKDENKKYKDYGVGTAEMKYGVHGKNATAADIEKARLDKMRG